MKRGINESGNGSIELIVLGLLAALIAVLAVPVISDLGQETNKLPRQTGAAWIK